MNMIKDSGFFRGMKILVTGHTGFIGSWLTKWLTMMDADVCGFSLDPPSSPNLYELLKMNKSIIDIRGDIRDKNLLHSSLNQFRPEIVIHLAAQPLVLESYNNPVETYDVNVTGTVNLLNELRKIETLKTIIVVTSDKSYHNNEWPYPYREIDPLGGTDPYSASKSCQDIVVNSFFESFFSNRGVGVASVRAGNVIGGGDFAKDRIIPDIVRSIINGNTMNMRNPKSIRPWQHVLEPIYGIFILANKLHKDKKLSGAWNFGPYPQSSITVQELTDIFLKYYGKGNYEIKNNQDFKESNYLQIDISKAIRKLGWSPALKIEETIAETAIWYKKYVDNELNSNDMTEQQILKYMESRDKHAE